MSTSRPYPHAVESERALLGALLQDPDRIRDLVAAGLRAADFYRVDHSHLYKLLLDRWRKGDPIDLTLVCAQIVREGHPEHYGGIGYVVDLPDRVPSTVNAAHYGGEVVEAAARRQVIELANHLREGAHNGLPLDELVGRATNLGRTLRHAGRHQPTNLSDSLDRHMDLIENIQNGGRSPVIPTGYRDLDAKLAGGLRAGDLVVLAARPAMGKTALLLNLLCGMADPRRANVPVGFVSLEMSEEQANNRKISMWSQVPLRLVRAYDRWGETHKGKTIWEHALTAADELKPLQYHADYRSGLTIERVWEQAKRWVSDHGIRVLGVDYLQLLKATDSRASREQQVAHMSRGLKAIAKDLGLAVIGLAQLNRALEKRPNKRPQVSDLRESGAIEQDADGIWFLYRDAKYNANAPDHEAEVIIAKQRQGEEGTVPLHWFGEYQLFQSVPSLTERRAAAAKQDPPVT